MRFFYLIFICLSVLISPIQSQEISQDNFNIEDHSIYFPYNPRPWKLEHGVGLSLYYMPKDWLETALSLPMIHYRANYSLKFGFAVTGDLRTIGVANEIAFGPSYYLPLGKRLHLGVGYQYALGLGLLYDLGYDNTLWAHSHRTQLRIGYRFEDFTLTLKGGLDLFNNVLFEAGDINLSSKTNFFNGYHFGAFLEQRMFKNKSMSLGFVVNRTRFHILGWPAFNSTRDIYYLPEINAIFVL